MQVQYYLSLYVPMEIYLLKKKSHFTLTEVILMIGNALAVYMSEQKLLSLAD